MDAAEREIMQRLFFVYVELWLRYRAVLHVLAGGQPSEQLETRIEEWIAQNRLHLTAEARQRLAEFETLWRLDTEAP